MAGIFPSIPEPGADAATQLATLRALKNAVELLVANSTGLKTATGVGSSTNTFALTTEVTSLIARESYARASSNEAIQTYLTETIDTQVAELNGDIATINGQITTINSSVATNASNISSEAITRATADSALTATINTVSANTATNAAAITSEAATRATNDTAIANNVTTLSTTVSGHTTTLQTQSTAIAGLGARYSVTLSTDGYVSGFSLLNGTSGGFNSSSFKVVADKFIIAYPGLADRQVFSVQNIGGTNTLTFDGSIIASGSITSLGVVTAGYLSDTANIANSKFLIDLSAKSIVISD